MTRCCQYLTNYCVAGQGNLYVLHLMGSHADFCERLNGERPSIESQDHELACYLSTYRKTDRFIEQAYQMLTKNGAPFKLFYFSDHGLSHKDIGGVHSAPRRRYPTKLSGAVAGAERS